MTGSWSFSSRLLRGVGSFHAGSPAQSCDSTVQTGLGLLIASQESQCNDADASKMQCTSHSRLGRRCRACSPSIVRLRRAAAGFHSRASMDLVIGSRQAGHTHIGLWPAAASSHTWLQLADVGRCILLQVGERRPHPRRNVHPHLHCCTKQFKRWPCLTVVLHGFENRAPAP